jgi:hypothetical protein
LNIYYIEIKYKEILIIDIMDIKKSLLKLGLAGLLAVAGCRSYSTDNKYYGSSSDLVVNTGFEYWNFSGLKHHHKTHPDDRAFLEGDAGDTKIKSGYFFNVNAQKNLGDENFNPYVFGGVLLGYGRDEKKNENDPRPTGSEARIYSDVFPLAPQVGVGVDTRLSSGLILGAEATGNIFWIRHGWNRFGEDERSANETKFLYNIGPVLKIDTHDGGGFKFKAAAGNDNWVFNIGWFTCF